MLSFDKLNQDDASYLGSLNSSSTFRFNDSAKKDFETYSTSQNTDRELLFGLEERSRLTEE